MNIAINGFGRIGRLVYRRLHKDFSFGKVVAINDLTDPKTLAHLLKYDSSQGRFDEEIVVGANELNIGGHSVKISAEKEPNKLPWKALGIDLVLECSGIFASEEKAKAHILAGAKKVVISAPASGNLKTIVYGVNHKNLDGSEEIISCASCTTNCLAPMAKVLEDNFGIIHGFMSTIHAYTNDQNTLDAPHKNADLRRMRAAAENIVPSSTGAAKAIALVIPNLKGKLDGMAQRVPVKTGSLTELVAVVNKTVRDAEQINSLMQANSSEAFGYTEEPLVSTDIIGINYGSLFDATQTKILSTDGQNLVKVAAWYDNEMSYVSQLLRTAKYFISKI